jgi:hypothetical protein
MPDVKVSNVSHLGPFEFRWPEGMEAFESGWAYTAEIGGARHAIRHGLGAREVYGRIRVYTVTWIGGEVQVEGAEADDYPLSQWLLSRLRRAGRPLASTMDQVPAGYEPFEIVEHRREIDAPCSPSCLAAKISEDDLPGWALHGWLRSQLPRRVEAASPAMAAVTPRAQLPPPHSPNAQAVGRALLVHADALAAELAGGTAQFTSNPAANALIHEDAFAFLLAVIADIGVRAERASAVPYEPRKRLGGLSPARLREDPAAVRTAVQQQPKLHRFVNVVPDWLVQVAGIVLASYGATLSGCDRTSPQLLSCAVGLRRFRA